MCSSPVAKGQLDIVIWVLIVINADVIAAIAVKPVGGEGPVGDIISPGVGELKVFGGLVGIGGARGKIGGANQAGNFRRDGGR